jgi:hypothetical protein
MISYSLSLSLKHSHFIPSCFCLCLCLSVSLYLSLSVSMCVSLCVCVSLCLSHSLFHSFHLSTSLSLTFSLCASIQSLFLSRRWKLETAKKREKTFLLFPTFFLQKFRNGNSCSPRVCVAKVSCRNGSEINSSRKKNSTMSWT